ncbi:splicing factor 3B subunit 2 isoform X1 [Kryptolebias marmoratus]|uniref:splicing factor 3B subunit 2 isoform X1 n=1 Tax=Kryptolebias marmoratus TaxID=37003 RepID=UPI0007F8BC2C|nr:splicing factor 3B subunit 2 isoform X1 [Kryptolebias marmoratus]
MASEGAPGTDSLPSDLGSAIAALNTWSNPELQAKLAELGAPAMGSREELIDRLKGYMMQTGIILSKSNEDKPMGSQIPGMPPLPPMPMPPMPPGISMLQPMGLMPPGLPMGMERAPLPPPGLTQDDQLKMVQHRAAMVLQQEVRVIQQGDEKDLLEQQKRAAVLLEQERQQEMAKISARSLPTVTEIRGPLPPGITLLPSHKQRVPPPPGEDNKEMWQNEEISIGGPKIPQALEKILQLKEIRQEQLTDAAEDDDDEGADMDASNSSGLVMSENEDDGQLSKKDKNRRRRNRKKKSKKKRAQEKKEQAEQQQQQQQQQEQQQQKKKKDSGDKEKDKDKDKGKEPEVEIEYVTEEPEIYDPNFIFFKRIFEAFKLTDDVKKEKDKEPEKAEKQEMLGVLRKKGFELERKDSDDSDEEVKQDAPKLSKKKLRRMNRLTVAELKQLVARPDVVEMHDVTAQEPKLLVHLKATRNTVPVPRHWCFKRKYLQGKRGIEKPPFELPEFIKRTGIQEMREALQEKEDAKTMKTKMREKVRPKMGKIDIDYQKLHDAFFKWQIKPKLTIHGDLYYEGKEFETRLKEKKPGDLSDELRIALGMPVGPNAHKVPPPWLIAMQRYGPPPSYPNLKIPGLNSPIPENCTFGYHAGGWGKPPVDEMGKPLYGDVFGTNSADFQAKAEEEEVDRTPWGELEPSDEESSEEEEEEESDEEKPDETGFFTPADSGLITPGGYSTVPTGMETPEIELRKKKIEEAMDGNETPQLFTVLAERRTGSIGGAMMGSTHIYDMSGAMASRKAGGGQESQGVEVALAPEELELDPMAMTQKYEEHVREQQAQVEKEDFSDMVAEHAAKQKQKKRKAQPQDTRGSAKKYKEFKF